LLQILSEEFHEKNGSKNVIVILVTLLIFQYAKLVPAASSIDDSFIMDKSPLPLTAQRLAQLRPGLIIEPGLKPFSTKSFKHIVNWHPVQKVVSRKETNFKRRTAYVRNRHSRLESDIV
jgi:hypothetical protein